MPFKRSVGYIALMKSVYVMTGLILLWVTGSAAVAQERRAAVAAPKLVAPAALVKTPSKRARVSMRRAIELAQQEVGGRVLSTKSFNSGGQGAQIYQIRLLVEGERVITVVVDAKGRVRRR